METNSSFDPNQTQWYPATPGSPSPSPDEGGDRRKKWTRIGVGSGIGLLVLVIALFFIRSAWEQHNAQKVVRAEKQTQAADTCDKTKNPEKCKSSVPVDLAQADGDPGYCANLSGQEKDSCLNAAALTAKDTAMCKQMADADQSTLCQDAVVSLLIQQQGESDALCAQYATPSTQEICTNNYLVALARSGDCSDTRITESMCKNEKETQEAIDAKDPALCEHLDSREGRLSCQERVGPGDVDGDGITADVEEEYGSSDHLVDSDGDGLTDAQEINVYLTSPREADTDGDGYPDGTEVAGGYDPLH